MRPGAYRPLTARRHSGGAMEFRILGPLEVIEGGEAIRLPGPKQRGLLALLLLHANEVVSIDRLIDELWPGERRREGADALQVYVSRLRKALGGGRRGARRVAPGYMLRAGRCRARPPRFERARRGGRGAEPASAAADAARGARALARAAARRLRVRAVRAGGDRPARGAPLASRSRSGSTPTSRSGATPSSSPSSKRSSRSIRCARVCAAADARALPLRAARPRRSRSTRRRAGRSSTELGIEPEPALQELEKAILRQDPSLELARATVRCARFSLSGSTWQGARSAARLAEALVRKPPREVIVARPGRQSGTSSASASEQLNGQCRSLAGRGVLARAAVFTSSTPGADAARLATEQDVDLVLVLGADRASRRRRSRAASVNRALRRRRARRENGSAGPVLVPFAGAEHDWSAIELGAWLAGGWDAPLVLAGPAVEAAVTRAACLPARRSPSSAPSASPRSPYSSSLGPDALVAAARDGGCRGRRPVRPLAEGRARAHTERSCGKRSADPSRAQGPETGRTRAARESHALHLVSKGRLIQRFAQGGG